MSIKSKSPEGYGVTTRKGYAVILSKILDDRADITTMANLACLSYAIAIEENKVVSGYGITSVFGYAVTKPCLKDYPSFQEHPSISHDAIMLRVFPITLIRLAKRWLDRLPSGSINTGSFNTWNLLEKAFLQRYCPLSKTTKQLEEIHNFKLEGNETLYQD
nr:hypothetical protein [Tanacetum cinerariifolium]